MADHTPVEIDPQQIEHAHELWAGFIKISKLTIIVSVVTLAILAAAFVNW